MPRADVPFRDAVKRSLLLFAIAITAAAAFAEEPPPPPAPKLGERADKMVQEGLPVCAEKSDAAFSGLVHKLPVNLTGEVIRVDSKRPACAGQWVAITSSQGGFFLGIPWFLDGMTGTPEQKLRKFTWENLQQNMEPVIGTQRTREGFYPVTLYQLTERGKMPMVGELDPEGNVLFIGHFHPLTESYADSRLKSLQPYLDNSPSEGATKPVVTVIEFSDFECPSCQRASGYMAPILEKYGDQVRYVRYDLPLLSMHPWAFAAAVAGRAIYSQKPALFWDYKKQVYANQDKLNTFVIDDFTRGFAQDHELDMKKYDADVNSTELQKAILTGAGYALSNDIRATPTYLVNGKTVDPGNDGKALEAYVAGLLKK